MSLYLRDERWEHYSTLVVFAERCRDLWLVKTYFGDWALVPGERLVFQ